MWWAALIPAIMALHKSRVDANNAKDQRKTQAEIAKWSPWTGMQANPVSDPDTSGTITDGGMRSWQMYQDMENRRDTQNLLKALTNKNNGELSGGDMMSGSRWGGSSGSMYS